LSEAISIRRKKTKPVHRDIQISRRGRRKTKSKDSSGKDGKNNEDVGNALNALEDACKKDVNIIPYSLECARSYCTCGEIFKVFKKAFGLWRPPVMW
jgi:methylmalonyl-CoA mutase N-terminal domain/subunit